MKQIKKILVAFILVLAIFLVACEAQDCPEPEKCPECNAEEVCEGLIDPSTCPAQECEKCPEPEQCPEVTCPEFDTAKECKEAGYITPGECAAGITAPESIEFYSEDITVGGTVKFEVEISPAKAYDGLVWLTSDPSIATVAEDGTITGIKPGKVTITAKSSVNGNVKYAEEVEVVEKGLLDYEIAEREKNAIVAALSAGYVSADFDLPTTWNGSAKVVYSDPNGKEITKFTMPDLGEATSQNYAISGSVTYKDSVSEFNVTLKLVAPGEGKNDYEKVAFAVEVAEAFLYEYLTGAKVEKDVFLPTSVYGVNLNWATNKAYVLAADGKLTRPNNDTDVNFTITPKLGAASASKTFTVTAAGFAQDDKIEYLKKSGSLAHIAGKEFVGSIPLPEYDAQFGIKLTYVSKDPKLVDNAGNIDPHAYDTEKQEVTFVVTAVYNDLNAPNDAFTEVFELKAFIAAYNDQTDDVVTFAAAHDQFTHVAYGDNNYDAVNEKQVILAANTYPVAEGWTIKELGDEGLFKIDALTNEVLLDAQYFRYHEATLLVTKTTGPNSATYVWTLNVGIGAEPHITYLGGRSQSYQASANPNERGDSLQGFSYWDKYVGIVANNNERTVQQYWSEFSGYTAYVDVPTGYKDVIYTLDQEGNVTIYPTDKDAHTRQQMFFMEFAVLRITTTEEYWGINKTAKVYFPKLANKESVRQTYGGNFGSLYVNETDKNIDIPVSALSMGGTFTDGAAMKTYTKSAIEVYKVDTNKTAVTLKDDYGVNATVKREQTWALDGYRPAMVAKPDVAGVLAEGTVNKPYTFTVGIQLSQEHADSNYIQYGIKSTESNLWGTPFVVLPANGGMAYAWHSQTLYSFSGMGGGYISGQNMKLKLYFSRYYRHANNEELSDYIRNDVRSYFTGLTGLTTDEYNKLNGAAAFAKVPVAFDDLGPTELAKIEALKKRLDALKPSWKEKEDVARAVDALDRVIAVATAELVSQKAYADLTEQLFQNVEAAFLANASGAKTMEETTEYYNKAEFQALLATAKRNYDSLTAGQKDLYDKGYATTAAIAGFNFAKKETAYIEKAINVALEIIALNDKVSEANKDKIVTYKNAAVNGGAQKKFDDLTVAGKALVSTAIQHKLSLLKQTVDLLSMTATTVAATTANITAAKGIIATANGGVYPAYEYTQIIHDAPGAPTFAVAQLYFKLNATKYEPVENPTQAEFDADLYYQISKTPAENSNADVKYVAQSFKDVKNDDRTVTWGIDAFFEELLAKAAANDKAAADKAAADRVALMAKTVTLAQAIKDTAPGLPSAKDAKSEGLGSLQSAYDGMMKYDATLSKTGKVDELIRAYYTLGLTTQNLNMSSKAAANLEKITDILSAVTGMYKLTTDVALDANKTYYTKGVADANGVYPYNEVANPEVANIATYYELEAAIGNFSGKNEAGILEDLFALPEALDKYAASLVEDMIDELPAVKNVEVSDEKAVAAAKTAYGKLTAAQQALVTNYAEIAALEAQIAQLKINAAIDPVADLIGDLPSAAKVELTDEAAIKAARKAYDALSAANKTAFDATYATEKAKLTACEAALTALIDADVAANEAYKAAVAAFDATELTGIVNKDTYAASKALVEKFEALTGHALEYFKDPTKYAGANAAKALYEKLRATVAAYEFYTTPAE